MKKRSREINIFSMSALDLFASAMGAFVIIAVIMFPYFPNTGDSPERISSVRAEYQGQIEELQAGLSECEARNETLEGELAQCNARVSEAEMALMQAESQLEQTQAELEGCRNDLQRANDQTQSCRAQLDRTYLVVAVSWSSSGDDVDLHVIDPSGNEYFYNARTFAGSPAALEEDAINGPGNEIWQHPEAQPGEYRIYYKYFKRNSGPAVVRGFLLHKDGRQVLPERTLVSEGEKPLIATIVVDPNGEVRLR